MEIAITGRIEQKRIELERQMRPLDGEGPSRAPQDAGVGDAIVLIHGQRVGGPPIALTPEQCAAGTVFKLPCRVRTQRLR
jgi:hypothetical protein